MSKRFCSRALYGSCLLLLKINLIEVALNKVLHKIWRLPPRSHTAAVRCVAQVLSISSILYHRSQFFLLRALSSSSPLIRTIFSEAICLINFFTGHNFRYGHTHVRTFRNDHLNTGSAIRLIQSTFSPFEPYIISISCQ